jgi:glutathione S-transferase
MRYLALVHGDGTLYPATPQLRAGIERWLDWTLSTLQPIERPLFWGLVRTPPAERDMAALQLAADAAAVQWRIVDAHLAGRSMMEGETFTLADLALATYARRWFGVEGVSKPDLPHLARWFDSISPRVHFQEIVAPPMS